jgi:hypothetical protein
MDLEGKIKVIGKTQSFGTNNFEKRDIVVTTEEQYPQHILVEFVKDKCALLDGYIEGQSVKVGINLRGREWVNPQGESKYFNAIQGWKIDLVIGDSNSAVDEYEEKAPDEKISTPKTDLTEKKQDDFPF